MQWKKGRKVSGRLRQSLVFINDRRAIKRGERTMLGPFRVVSISRPVEKGGEQRTREIFTSLSRVAGDSIRERTYCVQARCRHNCRKEKSSAQEGSTSPVTIEGHAIGRKRKRKSTSSGEPWGETSISTLILLETSQRRQKDYRAGMENPHRGIRTMGWLQRGEGLFNLFRRFRDLQMG